MNQIMPAAILARALVGDCDVKLNYMTAHAEVNEHEHGVCVVDRSCRLGTRIRLFHGSFGVERKD